MAGGRPRTVTPEKEELIELGKDLVRWAKEDTEELRCRFCQWYSSRGILSDNWELMVRKTEFVGYYEEARMVLGNRYLDGSINPSIAHRFLNIYCPEVRQSDREEKAFESTLKKDENKEINQQYLEQHKVYLDAMRSLQSSDLKMASNKSNPET